MVTDTFVLYIGREEKQKTNVESANKDPENNEAKQNFLNLIISELSDSLNSLLKKNGL